MGDYADKALKRLSDKKINNQLQQSAFLEKQRIKKDHGMPLWLDVRKRVKENCAELNTKARKEILIFEVVVDTELSVRTNLEEGSRRLRASFSEATGKLSWQTSGNQGSWTIEATSEGDAEFVGPHGSTTVEWIADEMLTALL